jgi:hypothetical protein
VWLLFVILVAKQGYMSRLELMMFWWMPFIPLFDPFNVSGERHHADEEAKPRQGNRLSQARPKTKRKAVSKTRSKAASRKSAARTSAAGKRAKRR